ncbi:glycosyltransferase [Clostridium sp. WILCCON 0269]|uniref:Glycosyltransferase n=1 Tax=Candidatus Clostridium eludens TaxID=3381663 RepID=A0ABW8SHE9_9CLOT
MIKVAVILPSFNIGGTENMVAQLATYVDKSKFRMHIISLNGYMDTSVQSMVEESGVDVTYCDRIQKNDIKVWIKVYRSLSKFKPDIIHSNMYPFLYTVPYLLTHKVKLLHTIHNKPVNEFKDVYKKVIRILYKMDKAIPVAISHTVEKEMRELYSLRKIERVYNPVDLKRFDCDRTINTSDEIELITVGRLMKQKNQALLFKAFTDARQRISNIKLSILGDGELKNELVALAKKLNILNHITFYGNVSNVEWYLAKADVFVLSSDYEGLPLSILEAMASGLPIVATDVGGVADVVTDNGFLINKGNQVELANKIVELAQSTGKRYLLGRKSKINSKQFDSHIFAKQYEVLYEKYLEKS